MTQTKGALPTVPHSTIIIAATEAPPHSQPLMWIQKSVVPVLLLTKGTSL